MKKKLILKIELVPASSWFSNVRSAVTAKQWSSIRLKNISYAYNICEICSDPGETHPLECHEIWGYNDEKLIQKLIGMTALCKNCHMVKHIGLAQIQGKGEKAMKHFMKVNKMNKADAEKYISEQFIIWAKRSKSKWTLDISLLKDYGINVEKIEENKKA